MARVEAMVAARHSSGMDMFAGGGPVWSLLRWIVHSESSMLWSRLSASSSSLLVHRDLVLEYGREWKS